MKDTTCTIHLDGPDTACGRHDHCTTVITAFRRDPAGHQLVEHHVCGPCRERLRLPDYDCTIDAHQTIRPLATT